MELEDMRHLPGLKHEEPHQQQLGSAGRKPGLFGGKKANGSGNNANKRWFRRGQGNPSNLSALDDGSFTPSLAASSVSSGGSAGSNSLRRRASYADPHSVMLRTSPTGGSAAYYSSGVGNAAAFADLYGNGGVLGAPPHHHHHHAALMMMAAVPERRTSYKYNSGRPDPPNLTKLEQDRKLQERLQEQDRLLKERLEEEGRTKRALEEKVLEMQQQLHQVQVSLRRAGDDQYHEDDNRRNHRSRTRRRKSSSYRPNGMETSMSELTLFGDDAEYGGYDHHRRASDDDDDEEEYCAEDDWGSPRKDDRRREKGVRSDRSPPGREATRRRSKQMTTTTRSVPRRCSSSDPSKKRVPRSEKPRVVARGEADPPAQRDGGRSRTARRRSSAAKVECTALVLRDNFSNQDDAEEPKARPRRRHSTTERQKEESLLQKEGKNGSARKLARAESKRSVVSEKSAGSSASSSRRHQKKVDDDDALEETPNEDIALFHFRRKESDGRLLAESTLKAQINECMSDLVKRLQREAMDNERGASGVLTFSKREAAGLKSGQRRIVFSLKHAKGARFTKEEFGRMQASEILWMTKVRPLVVDIQTERCPEENDKGDSDEGEAIDVF